MCCPERLKSAELTDKTIIFESFWDSGLPRFGEEGARGWSFWMDNKDLLPTESENNEKGIVYRFSLKLECMCIACMRKIDVFIGKYSMHMPLSKV